MIFSCYKVEELDLVTARQVYSDVGSRREILQENLMSRSGNFGLSHCPNKQGFFVTQK